MMSREVELRVTPLGILAVTEEGVVDFHKFGEDPEECVARYRELTEKGILSKEVKSFLKNLSAKWKLVARSSSLIRAVKEAGLEISFSRESKSPKDAAALLVEYGVFDTIEKADEEIRRTLNLVTIQRMKEEMEEKDKLVINAINAYDELTEIINIQYERLREWYGLHFPELEKIVRKYTLYAKLVSNIGRREEFTPENLAKLDLDEKMIRRISNTAKNSIGIPLSDSDLNQIVKYAEHLMETIKEREKIEQYIDQTLSEYAPNLTKLIGPKLAGKLIAKAGGLRKLASLPASTIQLLGAEKALFRALRRGTKPPKHGLIFQHPAVNRAPKKLRGKIARALAAKIAIAVRVDVFGTEDIGDKLRKDFEKKVKEVYKKASMKKRR